MQVFAHALKNDQLQCYIATGYVMLRHDDNSFQLPSEIKLQLQLLIPHNHECDVLALPNHRACLNEAANLLEEVSDAPQQDRKFPFGNSVCR